MKRIQLVIAAFLLATACSPKVNNGGYVTDIPIKDQLVVGQTTRDEVQAKLGSPSSQSTFGSENWYYITNRKESFAFLKPEVVQQDVTRVEFDNAGMVSKIDTYDKSDSESIAMVKRTTPTEGHTLGFFEQVLGNIGRFNAPSNDSNAPGRKSSSGGGL